MHFVAEGEVNEVYPHMVESVMLYGQEVVPRGERTKELHPAMMVIHNPRRRLVTAYGRPVNVPFMLAEVLWILQGRSDVGMLSYYNSNISNYSDDGRRFNAAYGERMRSSFGHDQLEDVILTLQDDPDTRQATIVLSDPVDDRGWERTWDKDLQQQSMKKHQTKDRACNVLAHLMIRDGALDWYQVIRSNDALWGTPYNYVQWTHVQEYVARRLDVPVGDFIHNVDSLHVYERQWEEARRIAPFDLYEYFDYDHAEMHVDPDVLDLVYAFELALRDAEPSEHVAIPSPDVVGGYWTSVCLLLQAWRMYKDGKDGLALDTLLSPAMDPVYGAATMRFFYYNRWHKPEYTFLTQRLVEEFEQKLYLWVVDTHV